MAEMLVSKGKLNKGTFSLDTKVLAHVTYLFNFMVDIGTVDDGSCQLSSVTCCYRSSVELTVLLVLDISRP